MAFMAALEADLRALSAEARRRHPAVKDAAEHAILKVRLSRLTSTSPVITPPHPFRVPGAPRVSPVPDPFRGGSSIRPFERVIGSVHLALLTLIQFLFSVITACCELVIWE